MTATQKRRLEIVPVEDFQPSVNAGLLDSVVEIGRERAKILGAMKEALLRGDDAEALECARELTGLARKTVPAVKHAR
jgi:uncharacterized membrane-anchored protein